MCEMHVCYKFYFCSVVDLDYFMVSFECQGHQVKVKVTGRKMIFPIQTSFNLLKRFILTACFVFRYDKICSDRQH